MLEWVGGDHVEARDHVVVVGHAQPADAMGVFVSSIPFNIYAILAVLMVGLIAAGILPEPRVTLVEPELVIRASTAR